MFTPVKVAGIGVLNETVLNTPKPQATSTVQRKCMLEKKFSEEANSEERCKQPNMQVTEEDSSLGILHNMSVLTNISTADEEQKLNFLNTNAELECVRKILLKCNDMKNTSVAIDTNKENNANVQNITDILTLPNITLPNETCTNPNEACSTDHFTKKASTNSIIFEPTEITARSSGINNTEKESLLNISCGSISFNTIAAQMMAEHYKEMSKEMFLSDSQVPEKLLDDDEASWQQNNTYSMPVKNTERSKLDYSSFCGIIGDVDLSIASCAGQKVSVGQYFQRKCDNIGILGNDKKIRPNFGNAAETPMKMGNLRPLVDSTIAANATTLSMERKNCTQVLNAVTDPDENSILSLSAIASTLQNVNIGTPRRMVDQLLMVQKKKKYSGIGNNIRKETFALPSERKSMLAKPDAKPIKFEDISLANLTAKLSLDSKSVNDIDVEIFSRMQSLTSDKSMRASESSSICEISKNNVDDKNVTSSLNQNADDIIIGKNTDQLCNCVVGMTCQANIELINKSDKWMRCSLHVSEIRGDQQNIVLSVSPDVILKSNGTVFTKIEIKVTKICKPIIAVLSINASDMMAKSKGSKKHMICFKPEELELDITCNSLDKQELDFEYITENSTKVLPIVFYNKNNIDVPIKLSILHDGPKMFSIDGTYNKLVKLNESHDELTHIVLKPQEKFSAYIKCERLQSISAGCSQEQPQYWKSKLIILVQCNDGTVLLTKEVPLCAQVGICKIQVVDTDVPIVVSKQHSKLLNIINSGNITTHVSATVVPMEGHKKTMYDFSIHPNDMLLQPGEKNSFLIAYNPQIADTKSTDNERHAKVQLIAGNNVYYYMVSVEQKMLEAEKENYLRCNTPCNLISTSLPTSPQSVTSSRHSPSSTVSSSAVTGNIIPIKTTHATLVWNSVKTGKSEIKEFIIRNTSNSRIKIQIDIWNDSKSFKFLGDRHTTNTSMVLAMQPNESRMLRVMFNPYRVGPVAGKIYIKHYTPARENREMQQHKKIPLYGYGGCGKVKISDTFKDANGKVWLSLGTLSTETAVLRAHVTVQNTGDVCSFAKIKIIPKVISPKVDSRWFVNPTELILNPKEDRHVLIEFHPKKEDFILSQQSDVLHVATVNVIYGDESTRWRIRRLYNKIKESGELARNENETFKNIVQPICKTFPGEQLIPGLMSLRDPVQCLNDLCTGVQQSEIMLTMEACADDTLPIHDADDESQMYYSLISDDSHVDEMGGASFFASQTMGGYETPQRDLQEHVIVNPSTIVLNPPIHNEATVTIFNLFKSAQSFQTSLTYSNYFRIVPSEGILPSGQNIPLKIQCLQKIEHSIQDILEIYTENNKAVVLIKVHVKRW